MIYKTPGANKVAESAIVTITGCVFIALVIGLVFWETLP